MHNKMKLAKSEEDVKDALVEGLKLVNVTKGTIDLKTDKIWFETKFDGLAMKYVANTFCQLFNYVQKAKNNGEALPSHLAIADDIGLALLDYNDIAYLFDNYDFTSYIASSPSKAIVSSIADEIKHFVRSYKYAVSVDAMGMDTLCNHIYQIQKSGRITKTSIMPNNLKHVYTKWQGDIGSRLIYEASKTKVEDNDIMIKVFYSDIFYDEKNGDTVENYFKLLFDTNKRPYFISSKGNLILDSNDSYRRFWITYDRPPKKEHKSIILARQDTLIPIDKKKFTGAYYTPLDGVQLCYDYIAVELGENWQDEYYVWDMAGGSGNLIVPHSNQRNCFISTLDDFNINAMKNAKEVVGATVFQYDYLNDDVGESGLDYSLTNKLPVELRRIIKEESHKLVVLINPPYGEAGGGIAQGHEVKGNISNTNVKRYIGHSNELYIQFIIRIQHELPQAKLAMFSTLKYLNASRSEDFRDSFTGQFLNGFILHSKLFESKGNFPIGFLLWQLGSKEKFSKVELDVYTDDYEKIGMKTFLPHKATQMLNKWFERPRNNGQPVVPLKNAVNVYTSHVSVDTWSDGAIGYMCCHASDIQNATQKTFIVSGAHGDGHGFYINKENLAQACVVFAVRRLVRPTWLNDRDQFLIPHTNPPQEFYNDCLIYTLFNGSNLSASADGLEYNGQKWSIVNHFIPFTEEQLNSPSRFESDFMVKYLKNLELSTEASAVMSEALPIWQTYYQTDFEPSIAIELKLNRSDVGWYQVRNAIKKHKDSDIFMKNFNITYAKLASKLEPQVYEYGFLIE